MDQPVSGDPPRSQRLREYRAARRGDRAARDRLVELLQPEIERTVRRRAGKNVLRLEAHDDLVQRTLVVLVRRLPRLPECRTEEELRAVVRQLAHWEIRRVLERRAGLVLREASADVPEPVAPAPTRGTVTRADDARHLRRLLARMKPAYAEVLRCRLLEGRSAEATATQLGISVVAVKKRLVRARRALEEIAAGPPARRAERHR